MSAEEAEFQGDVSNADDVRKHEARLKELRERLKEERDVWEVKVCIRPIPFLGHLMAYLLGSRP